MNHEEHMVIIITMMIAIIILNLKFQWYYVIIVMDTSLLKETQQFPDTSTSGAAVNNANEKVIFKSCASFTSCITKINNTKIDNAGDIDIIMPTYNR